MELRRQKERNLNYSKLIGIIRRHKEPVAEAYNIFPESIRFLTSVGSQRAKEMHCLIAWKSIPGWKKSFLVIFERF